MNARLINCAALIRTCNNRKDRNRGLKHDLLFIYLQGSEGSVENRGRRPMFITFPRDLANVIK